MKFQPLSPWVMVNESVTPENFYGNLKPSFEMGVLHIQNFSEVSMFMYDDFVF